MNSNIIESKINNVVVYPSALERVLKEKNSGPIPRFFTKLYLQLKRWVPRKRSLLGVAFKIDNH
jgi:hypothetical protein